MTKMVEKMLSSTDKELIILGISLLLNNPDRTEFSHHLNIGIGQTMFDYHNLYVKNNMAAIVMFNKLHINTFERWERIFKRFKIEFNTITL